MGGATPAMLIISGKRRSKKRLGFVADFCPVCREITAFSIHRFAMKEHLYGISLAEGKTLGHAGFCTRCGTQIAMDATIYASYATEPGNRVEELARKTFPYLRQARAERLALEEKLRIGRLSPWEREKLMLEPLTVFAELCEAKFGEMSLHLGGRGGWGLLGSFAVAAILFMVVNTHGFPEEYRTTGSMAAVGIFLAGFLYFFVNLFKEARRIYVREYLPPLGKALAPLRPKKEELEAYLERYRRAGFQLGKKARADELWEATQPSKSVTFVAPDLRK